MTYVVLSSSGVVVVVVIVGGEVVVLVSMPGEMMAVAVAVASAHPSRHLGHSGGQGAQGRGQGVPYPVQGWVGRVVSYIDNVFSIFSPAMPRRTPMPAK